MNRGHAYVRCVLTAGVAMLVWFATTEEVSADASEPGAYTLFALMSVMAGVVLSALLCCVIEVAYRIVRHLRRARV